MNLRGLLTLHSAISYLAHFSAVIPNTTHVHNNPIFDLAPSGKAFHFPAAAPPATIGWFGSILLYSTIRPTLYARA